jgi:hypothetical protein
MFGSKPHLISKHTSQMQLLCKMLCVSSIHVRNLSPICVWVTHLKMYLTELIWDQIH